MGVTPTWTNLFSSVSLPLPALVLATINRSHAVGQRVIREVYENGSSDLSHQREGRKLGGGEEPERGRPCKT